MSGAGPSFGLFGDPVSTVRIVVADNSHTDVGADDGPPGPLAAGVGVGLATDERRAPRADRNDRVPARNRACTPWPCAAATRMAAR